MWNLVSGADYSKVLIDTWWNVNLLHFRKPCNTRKRFNRYMVECEYIVKKCSPRGRYCFNRYMVECESGGASMP